eukprot:scaffold76652_cov31-Tisochrysis_lutea.AAC.8
MWEADKVVATDGAAARSAARSSLADAWIWPFLWHGNTSLFTGIFKLVEDRLNAKQDAEAGVQEGGELPARSAGRRMLGTIGDRRPCGRALHICFSPVA